MKLLISPVRALGAGAIGLSLAFTPIVAQNSPRSNQNSNPGEGLRRLLEGFGSSLDNDQRDQLNQALEEFQKSLEENPEQPRSSENDSSRRRGRVEAAPDSNEPRQPNRRSQPPAQRPQPADPSEQMRRQMEQMLPGLDLERFFGEDFLGPLMREMQRLQDDPHQDGASELPGLQGQLRERARSNRHEKAARRAMAEFRPVVRDARESVVTVYGDSGDQLALATIVTANGYALTKASVLGDDDSVEAEFSDGRVVKATKVDALEGYDLALLKLEADNLKPIQWNTTENLPIGTLLAASSPDEDPLAIGVVSVPPRSLDSSRKGFLGVGMDGDPDGVKIIRISEHSAAEKAGLQKDDVITAIDGKQVRSPKELTDIITRKQADDEVHISYRRGNDDKVAVAILQSRDDIKVAELANGQGINESEFKRLQRENDPTARMGGRGNRIADGFPVALQNDLLINANEVGGPVVDLDGKAVALNIARAERTKTYSIPAYAVAKLLATVDQGKLSEPKDANALKRDARKAAESLEQLRAQLKEAEEKARAAQDALEKQSQ
ncbi:MAG: S1C family serine protease [Verrucomicrobiales bacterium]